MRASATRTGRSLCWNALMIGTIRGCGTSNWTSVLKTCTLTQDLRTCCGASACPSRCGSHKKTGTKKRAGEPGPSSSVDRDLLGGHLLGFAFLAQKLQSAL